MDIGDKNEFDFSDIFVTMFRNTFDSKHNYTSFDFCFLCNSILDCTSNFNNIVLKLDKENEQEKNEIGIFESNKEENFWVVYHQLLEKQNNYILKAIKYSIQQHINLVNTSFTLLGKKKVKFCSSFRYAILSFENFSGNFDVSYLLLEKMSNLLIQVKYEIQRKYLEIKKSEKRAKIKPLVICLLDKRRKCYYVLGSNGIDNSSSSMKIKKK